MCGHDVHLPVGLNVAVFISIFGSSDLFYLYLLFVSFFEVNITSLLGIALVSLDQTSCPQP